MSILARFMAKPKSLPAFFATCLGFFCAPKKSHAHVEHIFNLET
jgi:hypothetical protein